MLKLFLKGSYDIKILRKHFRKINLLKNQQIKFAIMIIHSLLSQSSSPKEVKAPEYSILFSRSPFRNHEKNEEEVG